MITVAILINGNPIVAVNAIHQKNETENGETAYAITSGEILWHRRDLGAVALAKKLLDTIRNESK